MVSSERQTEPAHVEVRELQDTLLSRGLSAHALIHACAHTANNGGAQTITGPGMMIAMFAMLVPSRVSEVSALAPRALLAGTLACFNTACVAPRTEYSTVRYRVTQCITVKYCIVRTAGRLQQRSPSEAFLER